MIIQEGVVVMSEKKSEGTEIAQGLVIVRGPEGIVVGRVRVFEGGNCPDKGVSCKTLAVSQL
jgi:hypothetical protein